jgi:hypothetical protein
VGARRRGVRAARRVGGGRALLRRRRARIAAHAAGLCAAHHDMGRRLADRLRTVVGQPDVAMAMTAMQVLFVATAARNDAAAQGIPAEDMQDTVLNVIACAVMDLTMIERSVQVPR